MSGENGTYVSRAELAAHVKGIDEHFDTLEAEMIEIKYGIRGIVEALHREKQAREAFREGRVRAWGPPLIAAVIAASVSIPVALLLH